MSKREKTRWPIYQRLIDASEWISQNQLTASLELLKARLCMAFSMLVAESTSDCLMNWLWFRLQKYSSISYQVKLHRYSLTCVSCALRNGVSASLLIEAAWSNVHCCYVPYNGCSEIHQRWAKSLEGIFIRLTIILTISDENNVTKCNIKSF